MAVQHRRGVPANPFRGRSSPRGGLPTHFGNGGYRSAHHPAHSPLARLKTVCFFLVVGGLALYTFLSSSSSTTEPAVDRLANMDAGLRKSNSGSDTMDYGTKEEKVVHKSKRAESKSKQANSYDEHLSNIQNQKQHPPQPQHYSEDKSASGDEHLHKPLVPSDDKVDKEGRDSVEHAFGNSKSKQDQGGQSHQEHKVVSKSKDHEDANSKTSEHNKNSKLEETTKKDETEPVDSEKTAKKDEVADGVKKGVDEVKEDPDKKPDGSEENQVEVVGDTSVEVADDKSVVEAADSELKSNKGTEKKSEEAEDIKADTAVEVVETGLEVVDEKKPAEEGPLHGPPNEGKAAPWEEEKADMENNFQPPDKSANSKQEEEGAPKIEKFEEAEMEIIQPLNTGDKGEVVVEEKFEAVQEGDPEHIDLDTPKEELENRPAEKADHGDETVDKDSAAKDADAETEKADQAPVEEANKDSIAQDADSETEKADQEPTEKTDKESAAKDADSKTQKVDQPDSEKESAAKDPDAETEKAEPEKAGEKADQDAASAKSESPKSEQKDVSPVDGATAEHREGEKEASPANSKEEKKKGEEHSSPADTLHEEKKESEEQSSPADLEKKEQ